MIRGPIPISQYYRNLAGIDKMMKDGVYKNSIMEYGEGKFGGIVGELIVSDLLGWERSNTKDYDIVGMGMTSDVKTARTHCAPREEWNANVAATSLHQKCDLYVFCRATYDITKFWILGYIFREMFYKKAVFYTAGSYDPVLTPKGERFQFPVDTYSVKIIELHDVKVMKI